MLQREGEIIAAEIPGGLGLDKIGPQRCPLAGNALWEEGVAVAELGYRGEPVTFLGVQDSHHDLLGRAAYNVQPLTSPVEFLTPPVALPPCAAPGVGALASQERRAILLLPGGEGRRDNVHSPVGTGFAYSMGTAITYDTY